MNIDVIFDNGGGITIQTTTYAHYYQDPAQAAEDYKLIISGADTGDWEGNEIDNRMEYDAEQVRNGGYLWLNPNDIKEKLYSDWGYNTQDFYNALLK